MVQCAKCKLYVSLKSDDVGRCKGPCEKVYHKKCSSKLQQSGICEVCVKIDSPGGAMKTQLQVDPKHVSVESLLKEVNTKLSIIYKMEKNLEDLRDTVDFYAEQYQAMVAYKEESERKIKSLEQKNVYLEKCNSALEERILDLESKEKERNIEIVGLEKKINENIMDTVRVITQKLNLKSESISSAMRVGREKERDNKITQSVVLTLRTKMDRDSWLSVRKTRITNNCVYKNGNDYCIYIHEDLPRYKRQLLWNAKTELKARYKYVWVQNSNILARKENDKKIYKIKCERDIENLKKSAC